MITQGRHQRGVHLCSIIQGFALLIRLFVSLEQRTGLPTLLEFQRLIISLSLWDVLNEHCACAFTQSQTGDVCGAEKEYLGPVTYCQRER